METSVKVSGVWMSWKLVVMRRSDGSFRTSESSVGVLRGFLRTLFQHGKASQKSWAGV